MSYSLITKRLSKLPKITRYETRTFEEEIPTSLNVFKNWTFSSGCTTGEDFKIFTRKFKSVIVKAMSNAKLVNFSSNHYFLSGFFEKNGKYVYFSISDVRFFPKEWFNHILVRTAQHDKDYTGGCNNYTTLEEFSTKVNQLLER